MFQTSVTLPAWEVESLVSCSLQPHGLLPTRLFCPWDSPGKNTGVGCHSLLQGLFLTHGSNLGLLNCRQILYCLNHQGNSHNPIESRKLRHREFKETEKVHLVFPWHLTSSVVPGGLEGKESVCNSGDPGLVPGLGRSPGEGNDSPLQYSCLENTVDGGVWRAIAHGVAKSRTQLSD